MSQWHSLGPFTVFDLETTGCSQYRDRIVEIAAVRVDLDGGLSRFSSLVNPGVRIPQQAVNVHGITDEMVKDAPRFHDAAYKFLDFARGSKLVAHNARFDLSFLQESLFREGLPLWQGGSYDSIVLVRKAYPGLHSYSLQSLRVEFALDEEGQAHRAGADAEWTMQIFSMAMKRLYETC
jgi:DNA polymerase III epsilon subunit family exonuclease